MTAAGAFSFARALWRAYGVRGSVVRALHEVRKKAGWYRAAPRDVAAKALESKIPARWPFVVDAKRVAAATDRDVALARANRVRGGEHQAYRWTWVALPKTVHEWRTHPVTGHHYEIDDPWFTVPHYNPNAGDVKDVWEPARFGWSYDLMRGWMLTGDDSYAAAFWEKFETFIESNPPYRGVHWSCGQETTIRAIAWLWAETTFADAPSSTPARLTALRRALIWSAERVDDAIDYAVYQRNNHGVSETAGLGILGARFLDDEPRAARWLQQGHDLLEAQVLDQFLEDGWYLQHSFNYARLALDQVVFAERALRSRNRGLSRTALGRVAESVKLLADVMDSASGRLPNHGPNDGAYVLPLSTAEYRDYRPSLTAAAVTSGGTLPSRVTPNAEVLAWLDEDRPAVAPERGSVLARSGASGWAIARAGNVVVFARAGRYRSRPSHMDPLHVDIWINGEPVAIDAGTYRYWADAPWSNGLVGAELHNTITIEGMPVAKRGPRYLWVTWPSARVESVKAESNGTVRIEMVHETWQNRGVEHRRVVEVTDAGVRVNDQLIAPDSMRARATAHWLLAPNAALPEVTSDRTVNIEVRKGNPDSVFAWQAEGYGEKLPVVSLLASATIENGGLRFTSSFAAAEVPKRAVAERKIAVAAGPGQ